MTLRNILSLAIGFYFVSIIFSNCYADEKEKLNIIWEDKSIRDPFVSIADVYKLKYQETDASQEAIPSFPMELKGLMLKNDKSVAIINEEVVAEGQIWHGFKVEDISDLGVTLSYKDESLKLIMKEEDADTQEKTPAVEPREGRGR